MARNEEEKLLHIVMFPWLAFGHILPYLELAKLIAQRGHRVSFVSTPRNIQRLSKLPPNLAPLIKFVNLPLPKVENLPENAEATTDVPYDVVPFLKQAYDGLQEPLTRFLESSKADWMFNDFAAFWAGSVASRMGIKSVFYSIFTAPCMGFMGSPSHILGAEPYSRTKLEDFTFPPPWVPFPTTVACHLFEMKRSFDSVSPNASGVADMDRYAISIQNCDFLVVRGCTKFEPEWFQVLENIYQKPVLPVGQLPSTGFDDGDKNDTWQCMKDWFNKQARGSVVYVAFGSEMKPNQAEVNEIALGLEKSKLPFFWTLRLQRGPCDPDVLRLPEGFEERTQGRGVVCTTWAPQLKILSHVAVGGFLTHAGCSSVVEAVQTEKPLILLTFLADHGLNARVLEEKKMGYTVPRNERDGSFTSDTVADSVRLVMVEEEGRIYREKIKEVKDLFVNKERQERYIDELLYYLGTLSK
ncbi:UDP-glycosyltransferase 91A1-like [Abrus precatorius]|uniref:UDP-glycosyltransferase 91A1-like n=1 Tax=Abrus precatorius TaxID=3816 RepID=A0A8B8KSR8_ABRPR|nr:UDP-glycosyltransferase 91A1-like [Abrus precatorius]